MRICPRCSQPIDPASDPACEVPLLPGQSEDLPIEIVHDRCLTPEEKAIGERLEAEIDAAGGISAWLDRGHSSA